MGTGTNLDAFGGAWNRPHGLTGLFISVQNHTVGLRFGSGLGTDEVRVVPGLGEDTV